MKNIVQPYKKEFCYSYTSGAYATIELLTARPGKAECVIIHSAYNDAEALAALCKAKSVPVYRDDRLFKRINQKENTYVLGLFDKYSCKLSNGPHAVLVNPGDMGNLGCIMRTLAGVNIKNLAIITPAADMWHPKTIRASMGAVFRLEICQFTSFEEYSEVYPMHDIFPFMLDGSIHLTPENCPKSRRFSLVFGNEASGLPASFQNVGTSIKLPQSSGVDSLNLSVAVGIGSFVFASVNGFL